MLFLLSTIKKQGVVRLEYLSVLPRVLKEKQNLISKDFGVKETKQKKVPPYMNRL